MICDKCKNSIATLEYIQNINGEKIRYNLCSACFNQINEIDFFNKFLINVNFKINTEYIEKCDNCGNTVEKIKNTGRMGCMDCYKVFKGELLPILDDIQFSKKHTGKIPKGTAQSHYEKSNEQINKIKELKIKLEKAVFEENYEFAIKIRDEIKALKGGS